ncbi:hypothetical protein B0H13DRAFT_2684344 [Mycena leptocephala]|nr:hypothetical protein B0H13DRAFT_2684344 [Mycena leptocephala]
MIAAIPEGSEPGTLKRKIFSSFLEKMYNWLMYSFAFLRSAHHSCPCTALQCRIGVPSSVERGPTTMR